MVTEVAFYRQYRPVIGRVDSGDQGAYRAVAFYQTEKIALVRQVEDDYRQLVVHTQGERGAVHDFEAPLQGFHVRQLVELSGVGVAVRVGIINAVDAVL